MPLPKLFLWFFVTVALLLGSLRILQVADSLSDPVTTAFEEDAFYGFDVARNLARGKGLRSGPLGYPTTGFQPLWTLLVALIYAIGLPERLTFVFISCLSLILWGASAFLFAKISSA